MLTEAWAALSPLLAGRIPVGPRIDEQLGWIDFELKRNGVVERMPLGVDVPATGLTADERAALRAPTALERARAIRDLVERRRAGVAGTGADGSTTTLTAAADAGTPFPHLARGRGYLLSRSSGELGNPGPDGFVVGGNLSAQDDAAQVLAEVLEAAWARVVAHDQDVVDRLRDVETHFGVQVLPEGLEIAGPIDLTEILVPGARVCFTGEVVSATHGSVDRSEMEHLARQRGLTPVPNLTKTRTDVLVVAERGTQSNKSKNAARWDKPVLEAEEFLAWAHGAV
ncbi:hypothetical protein [Brachybacterium tyrofermentans]|uniref:hypothetical protein n=1 Tax=Brachybacterium tyrofermentans TaxID=47848 RepID=UPI003FD0AA54